MSFSQDVKGELSKRSSGGRHCRIAELAAIFSFVGQIKIHTSDQYNLVIRTENHLVVKTAFTLIRKSFTIRTEISVRYNPSKGSTMYFLIINQKQMSIDVLEGLKRIEQAKDQRVILPLSKKMVFQESCCKRAYLRGAFLAAGSMSDPSKAYHFEIVCPSNILAKQVQSVMQSFQLDAKIVSRKKSFVVYLKEGAQVVEALSVMEAHVALMELENIRILREIKNSINRQTNCELANVKKTASASFKQVRAIRYIQETVGLLELPENLYETAELRLENPELSLVEIGQMLTPAIGKSGVNHRLRKIVEIADKIREMQGGEK